MRQIDGLGAGNSQTSKAMFVDPVTGPDDDVQMTLAQVAVANETVDWGGNCGNMTAAVGLFAIDAGLVPAIDPVTVVRIISRNTGVRVAAHVPVHDGAVVSDGDYAISGVPGRGAKIVLQWFSPGGSVTGRLLPTGRPLDVVRLRNGQSLEVSIVDAANPVVFCDANAVGLIGTELPDELSSREDVVEIARRGAIHRGRNAVDRVVARARHYDESRPAKGRDRRRRREVQHRCRAPRCRRRRTTCTPGSCRCRHPTARMPCRAASARRLLQPSLARSSMRALRR